jgi:hypothetical protein
MHLALSNLYCPRLLAPEASWLWTAIGWQCVISDTPSSSRRPLDVSLAIASLVPLPESLAASNR